MELKKKFYFPLVLFLIAFIGVFIWLGWYSWPSPGDDFTLCTRVEQSGFWEFQKDFFLHDNGRLFNGFLMSVCLSLPFEATYKFWAILTILTYAICVWIFIKVTPPHLSVL